MLELNKYSLIIVHISVCTLVTARRWIKINFDNLNCSSTLFICGKTHVKRIIRKCVICMISDCLSISCDAFYTVFLWILWIHKTEKGDHKIQYGHGNICKQKTSMRTWTERVKTEICRFYKRMIRATQCNKWSLPLDLYSPPAFVL